MVQSCWAVLSLLTGIHAKPDLSSSPVHSLGLVLRADEVCEAAKV